MQVFRKKCPRVLLTLITGLLFLNMGFFMLEVKMLGLHHDPQILANISNMLAGAALEEERDASPQSTNLAEEEYVAGHHSADYTASLYLIRQDSQHLRHDGACRHGYYKKFNPPPER